MHAQQKAYAWVSFDTTLSEHDTTYDGTPAQYIQQYDTAKIEKHTDGHFYIWTRALPVVTTHRMSLSEHQAMSASLFSKYSYAAYWVEIDSKEKRYKTWQWMYYDDRDDPVSGLKLSVDRQVSWYNVTPSLRKLLNKIDG